MKMLSKVPFLWTSDNTLHRSVKIGVKIWVLRHKDVKTRNGSCPVKMIISSNMMNCIRQSSFACSFLGDSDFYFVLVFLVKFYCNAGKNIQTYKIPKESPLKLLVYPFLENSNYTTWHRQHLEYKQINWKLSLQFAQTCWGGGKRQLNNALCGANVILLPQQRPKTLCHNPGEKSIPFPLLI